MTRRAVGFTFRAQRWGDMAGRSRSLVNMKIIAALTDPDSAVPTGKAWARPDPQPEEEHL